MTKQTNKILYTVRVVLAAAVLCLSFLIFLGIGSSAALIFHVQAGPAFIKCIGAFAAGAASIVLLILILTFCFGRFYCSLLCPFGILQEMLSLSLKRKITVSNLPWLRCFFLGAALVPVFFGSCLFFRCLGPYSNFGRMIAGFFSGGAVVLCLIILLLIWKRRIWCTAVCPVGTLLGWISKYGLFRFSFSDKCVKCGKCAEICPVSCMDPKGGRIDNERCIRCLKCLANCPTEGVRFSRENNAVPFNASRRTFLLNGSAFLAGAAVGIPLAKTSHLFLLENRRFPEILPPGAGNEMRFFNRCTDCRLCVASCPEKILESRKGTIVVNLNKGACRFDCKVCTEVCPTGALPSLSLKEKQRTKIGQAVFLPQNCIVFQEDEPCGKCAEVCPVGAVKLRKNGTPLPVNTDLCIGCGACRKVCPAEKKAMEIHGMKQQILS